MIILCDSLVSNIESIVLDEINTTNIKLLRNLCLLTSESNKTYHKLLKRLLNDIYNKRNILNYIDLNNEHSQKDLYNYLSYLKDTSLIYSEEWFTTYNKNFKYYIPISKYISDIALMTCVCDTITICIYKINNIDEINYCNFNNISIDNIYKAWPIVIKKIFTLDRYLRYEMEYSYCNKNILSYI